MEIKEARAIVEQLADGIDPITGEVLPDDSHYNHPKVIRALFTLLNAVRMPASGFASTGKKNPTEKQHENLANGRPKNAGLPWSEAQKEQVAIMFKGGESINELAEYFERTAGAIRSELKHQGLIE